MESEAKTPLKHRPDQENRMQYLADWELEIIRKYPEIYLTPNLRLQEWMKVAPEECPDPSCNLRFGFEFQQGWKELVASFSETTAKLVHSLKTSGQQPDAYVRARVFKEKFGQLRWQGEDNLISPFKELFEGYVESMQRESLQICQKTGKRLSR